MQNIRKSIKHVLSEKKIFIENTRLVYEYCIRIHFTSFFKGLKMGSSPDKVLFSSFQHLAEPISSQR